MTAPMPRPPRRRREPAIDARGLLEEADRVRKLAYAPYSRFRVGAALLTKDGRIITGTNVENASFGLSICAERAAIFRAIAEGEKQFVAVAVTAGSGEVAMPCGACRQVLNEFAPGVLVFWRDRKGRVVRRRLTDLLPDAFVLKREGA